MRGKAQPKPLSTLLVTGFDNEQIWQQLEVFNQPLLKQMVLDVASLSTTKRPLTFNIKQEKSESKTILKINNNNNNLRQKKDKKKKVKFAEEEKIEVFEKQDEDFNQREHFDFFDSNEMESFLDAEDRKEMNGDDGKPDEVVDGIDYFADIPSESEDEKEGTESAMYLDFFDPPKSSKTKMMVDPEVEEFDEEEGLDTRDVEDEDMVPGDNVDNLLDAASSSDEENIDQQDTINDRLKSLANENFENDFNDESKSEFERSQALLKRKIAKAERELLHPHNLHWQLSGETTGDVRPENSLLEEYLQFDQISKPAPQITEHTTKTIEDLIRQRIKDKAFDDVVRKEKPNEKPFEFRRRITLESEKSKVGLAEVYEKEYLKEQERLAEKSGQLTGSFVAAGEAEESKTRQDVRRMMRSLFRKLDALSAFHYTPRPPEPEIKVLNNMPAISVEEVTPDTVSDMKLLAPEEVFSTRGKMVLQAKTERTTTDRLRARRVKKKKQSIKQKFVQEKQKSQKQNGGKKGLSSSAKFFEKLQESNEMAKVKKPKPKLPQQANYSKRLKL